MPIETFALFLVTTIIIVFTPGAAAITVAAQGAANGGGRALAGAAGIAAANVVYFALSATGIASLIVASNTAFMIIKWAGVGYLVWLGLNAIFSRSGAIHIGESSRAVGMRKLFGQGFVVEIANPKALMYFVAILPQFINTGMPILTQILIMGATTLLIDLISYSSYAFLGGFLRRDGLKSWVTALFNRTAGAALLFAAFRMAGVSAAK
jgi:threonine/homoserine/homoserine lactone efflux protein